MIVFKRFSHFFIFSEFLMQTTVWLTDDFWELTSKFVCNILSVVLWMTLFTIRHPACVDPWSKIFRRYEHACHTIIVES